MSRFFSCRDFAARSFLGICGAARTKCYRFPDSIEGMVREEVGTLVGDARRMSSGVTGGMASDPVGGPPQGGAGTLPENANIAHAAVLGIGTLGKGERQPAAAPQSIAGLHIGDAAGARAESGRQDGVDESQRASERNRAGAKSQRLPWESPSPGRCDAVEGTRRGRQPTRGGRVNAAIAAEPASAGQAQVQVSGSTFWTI